MSNRSNRNRGEQAAPDEPQGEATTQEAAPSVEVGGPAPEAPKPPAAEKPTRLTDEAVPGGPAAPYFMAPFASYTSEELQEHLQKRAKVHRDEVAKSQAEFAECEATVKTLHDQTQGGKQPLKAESEREKQKASHRRDECRGKADYHRRAAVRFERLASHLPPGYTFGIYASEFSNYELDEE